MKIKFLDGIRGIAAVYVMIGHARWLLWEGFQNGYKLHPGAYSFVDKILMYFFSMFKFGHQFVLLFFVLSGFVIHINYCRKFQADPGAKINVWQFYYRRIKRIYPPFLFALLLTMVLDTMGKYYGLPIYFGHTPYALLNSNIGDHHEISTLIGNVFFVYTQYCPLYGTNGPTWSLKLEWWFYLVYPAFLMLSRRHIFYSSVIVILLFIASFFPGAWPEPLLQDVFSSMISWWLGVVLAEIVAGRLKVHLFTFASFCLVMCGVFLFLRDPHLEDLCTALLFAAILAGLIWLNEKGKDLRILEKLKPLGDFSYSLYIMHFPILVFLSGIIMKYDQGLLPQNSFFVIAGIAICLIISYLAHFVFEIPFQKKGDPSKNNM